MTKTKEALTTPPRLTQQALIDASAKEFPKLKLSQIQKLFSFQQKLIMATLVNGGSADFRGFGSYRNQYRRPRKGRNPQTGQPLNIPATTIPTFIPSKHFKRAVGESAAAEQHVKK